MTARELKARYRGSVLGFLWSLANPLLLLGVYTFVFGLVFQPRAPGQSPYPVFLVAGLFPWVWVSSSLNEATASLTANAALIRRSVFPVELLPVVAVLSNLVNFLLSVPILIGALLVARALGHPVGGPWIVLLPLVVALHLPFLCGISARAGGARGPLQGRARPGVEPAHAGVLPDPDPLPDRRRAESQPARAGRVEPG